jgi:hypothetical protein
MAREGVGLPARGGAFAIGPLEWDSHAVTKLLFLKWFCSDSDWGLDLCKVRP